MSVVGLFAGVGGFELAFSQAGFSPALLVEIDPTAREVLRAKFPGVELAADVAELTELPGDTTVLTAGFPCQNLSMAGDKSGLKGSKSRVVGRMFDLIQKSSVPTVVIENVNFMLHLDSGNAMLWLVEQFEQLRYSWAYRVLDTMGFGLPHRRRRVYLVASRVLDPRDILFSDETNSVAPTVADLTKPLGFYWTEGRSGIGLTSDGIPPIKIGSSIGIPSPPAVLFPDGEVLIPSLRACERLQGFPPDWTSLSDDMEEKKSRWRMIGNAVSVPVAAWVAQRIKTPGTPVDFVSKRLTDRKWPSAAWNVGSGRMTVVASSKPIQTHTPSIGAFRDVDWARLSERALNGFIARAEAGNLQMPEGFLEALRAAPRSPVRNGSVRVAPPGSVAEPATVPHRVVEGL